MASNVWVLIKSEKSTEYVRGDEIIEVIRRSTSHLEYGKPITTWSVAVTKARTADADAGTCPDTIMLWTLPDESTAAGAALALLAALSGSATGVVVLGDDHRVRVVTFDELASLS